MRDFLRNLFVKKEARDAPKKVAEETSPPPPTYADIQKEHIKKVDEGTPWEIKLRPGEDTAVVTVPTRSGHLQELTFSVIQKDAFFESEGTIEEIFKQLGVVPLLQTPVMNRWEGMIGYRNEGDWPEQVVDHANISNENFHRAREIVKAAIAREYQRRKDARAKPAKKPSSE